MRNRTDKVLQQLEHVSRLVRSERKQLQEDKENVQIAQHSQEVIQSIAQAIQQNIHQQICGVVTRCLQAVFPDNFSFHIHFDRKRGKTEARPVIMENGKELHPLKGSGTGIAEIAAFALRLACLMLSRPKRRRVLVLDEPFVRIWEGYHDLVKSLLEQLADELDMQIILITQNSNFQMGKVIDLNKTGRQERGVS